MSQANVSGTHNPSPYLRRYRLPVLPGASTAYDDLLSPIDNNAKLEFITIKNAELSSGPSSATNPLSQKSPPTTTATKPSNEFVCSTSWCYPPAEKKAPFHRPVMRFELSTEIEEMERRNKELLDIGSGGAHSSGKHAQRE